MKLEKGTKATAWSASPYDAPTTEQIKSQFTMDASGISILGKKIAFTGVVTFNALASDAKNQITNAQNNAINTSRENIAQKLGYSNYQDMINKASAGQTIINGGYIRTNLIKANELVVNKISAATGSFQKLDTPNGKGSIGFNDSGITINGTQLWAYGDMYSQGQTAGRSNRFYASNIRCRGSLGFTQLNTLVLKGSYGFYYPNGYGSSALTVYFTRKTSSTGEAYYEVPVYGGPNNEAEIAGFPVNLIVFSWSGNTTRYTYNFTMAAHGQVIHLFNANDASGDDTRCYFVNGKRGWIMGGGARYIIAIRPDDLYPAIATNLLGRGWMEGAAYDNNWR